MPVALDHSALASYDNRLYLLGGFLQHRIPTPQLFIYDPETKSWQEGEPMPPARAGLASQFVEGILYSIGGSSGDNSGALSINEAYNPKTNSWIEMNPMPSTPRHHISSTLVDGMIFVIGGRVTEVTSNLNINQKYDPKNNTWVELAPMLTKRNIAGAVSVDGNVYVMGGEKISGSFNKLEKYNPKNNSWTVEEEMPTARLGLDAVNLDSIIYAVGVRLINQQKAPQMQTRFLLPNNMNY